MAELRKLFPYIRKHLPLLTAALVLLMVSGALEALIITLLAPIFNQLSPGGGGSSEVQVDKFDFLQTHLGLAADRLDLIAFYLVGFAFLKGLFLYAAEYSMSYTGQRVVAGLRRDVYSRLLDQSPSFFALNPTGKLMARVLSDTERLQETVSKTLTDFMRQIFLLIFFLGLVFYTDWKLALLSFLVAPAVLMITYWLGKKVRRVSWRSQENLSEISARLQETITGQKIVRAFGMEDYESRRFDDTNRQLVRVNLKAARITALNSPLIEFIGYVSFVPFLLYANYQLHRGLTVGIFVVFVAALFRLYEPVRKLSRMHLHFQQAFASAGRVFEVLEAPVEIRDRSGARELPPFSRELAFEDVTFRYQLSNEGPVLRNIHLRVAKGEMVALVGSSGAGKTSLVSLIPRFYDVTEGRITIDGIDIRGVTLASLRRQIAIVTQDTFLFDDTVRNNIAYGRQDCSLDEVTAAARAAFLHDFIESLSNGYDTRIGERGQRFSGGQRQRVAIARAILKEAPILILDEATSALDTESEHLVQEALYNLMKHCTTLVIAHRLSTVRKADRIVVMEGGRIVETGDHESLLKSSGVYRRLHDMQFVEGTAERLLPAR